VAAGLLTADALQLRHPVNRTVVLVLLCVVVLGALHTQQPFSV
jgi:hypothetical protein